MDGITKHTREVVRLADMVVAVPRIAKHTFEDCLIIGPAVLATTGEGTVIEGCTFDADADALLWTIQDDRDYVVGAIEAASCQFIRCRFSQIGFAGNADFIAMFRAGVA